jgi:hypothetical protein
MDYLRKNLAHLRTADDTEIVLGRLAGMHQTTVGRYVRGETDKLDVNAAAAWARHFGVGLDDLVSRDLANEGPSRSSQSTGLDEDKIGHALTSMDRVLRKRGLKMEGALGTYARLLIFAYELANEFYPDGVAPSQRRRYDELVELQLGGVSHEGKRSAEEAAQEGARGPASSKAKRASSGRS